MSYNTGTTYSVTSLQDLYPFCEPAMQAIYGSSPTTTLGNQVKETWYRFSNTTANYAVLRKRGLPLPCNGFSFSKTRAEPLAISRSQNGLCTSYFSRQHIQSGMIANSALFPSVSLTAAEKVSADKLAINALLAGVKGQPFNGALALAEGHKTLTMIAETATKIAKCYSSLRSGDIVKAYNSLGQQVSRKRKRIYHTTRKHDHKLAAENEWLALQFGWKPLLADLYGAAETLAAYNHPLTRSRCVGVSNVTLSFKPTVPLNGGTGWQTQHTVSLNYSRKYVVYFSESSTAPTITTMGFTNPLVIAWELVPFSFVVDWFLPIGTYLQNVDASLGKTFQSGTVTTFQLGTFSFKCWGYNLPSNNNYWNGNGSSSQTTISCVRELLTGFPSNQLPEFKSPLSLTHAIDAIALVKQAFFK